MKRNLSQKRSFKLLNTAVRNSLFVISFFFAVRGQAQTIISNWTFEGVTTTNTGTTPTISVGSAIADAGSQTAGSAFTGFHTLATAAWSNPAGNGSAKSLSSNGWSVGDYYQFLVNTTGYNGIAIAFDQVGSGTGPARFQVQYSTNGSTFTNGPGYIVPTSNWSAGTGVGTSTFQFDFSSVTALNNAATVYFRLVDTSTVSITGGVVATGGTGRVDNFRVSQGALILPLDILSFTASKSAAGNLLAWTTANEVNVQAQIIERSRDGRAFFALTQIAAGSNSYQYTDAVPLAATNYYRLKIVDRDGGYRYSKVVAIVNGGNTVIVTGLYPTLTTGNLTFEISAGSTRNLQLIFADLQGHIAMTRSISALGGNTTFTMNAGSLAAGAYIVKVVDENKNVSSFKFIKQ